MLVSREDPGISNIEGPFTFGQRLGIVFIVEAAFLSLFSVLGLLLYITVSWEPTDKQKDVNIVLQVRCQKNEEISTMVVVYSPPCILPFDDDL